MSVRGASLTFFRAQNIMSSTSITTVSAPILPRVTYSQSFHQWCKSPSLKQAEYRVLSLLPFYPQPDLNGKRRAESHEIPTGPDSWINEFEIINSTNDSSTDVSKLDNLVLLHGYGAALGFYYRNLPTLSQFNNTRVIALDLPGHGLSSRNKFNVGSVPSPQIKIVQPPKQEEKQPNLENLESGEISTKIHYSNESKYYLNPDDFEKSKNETKKMVTKTEDWFVDQIEEWRKAKDIDKFSLLGHSMGGYLAVSYALKHPERVDKLILASPMGVERSPYSLSAPSFHDLSTKEDKKRVELQPSEDPSSYQYIGRLDKIPSWFITAWNRHISPLSVIRLLGPIGPKLVSNWTYYRFGKYLKTEPHDSRSISEIEALHSYTYKSFTGKASGEYAITRLLAPGVLARSPILDKVSQLKSKTLWMYGDVDWMNSEAGKIAVNEMNKNQKDSAKIEILNGAGHNVFLDNPRKFDDLVLSFLGWGKK